MRSASAIASSTSWVTSTTIMRRLSTSLARSPCSCRASGASSDTNGWSSRSRVGRTANARASARDARGRSRVGLENARDARRGRARRTRSRLQPRSHAERRDAHCPRRCATGGAGAPGNHATFPWVGMWTEPSKLRSSPARMRISVDLPQPDGPINAPVSPSSSANERLAMTGTLCPAAVRKVFSATRASSRTRSPTGDVTFKGLHRERFDDEHDGSEGQSVGQQQGHVE